MMGGGGASEGIYFVKPETDRGQYKILPILMSVLIDQVVLDVQQFVVFQTPPPSEPIHATDGLSGSLKMTFVRPALLPGP